MLLLVVNYHYIEMEDKYPFPGIYPASLEKLDNQIEELGRHFTFISQQDLIEAAEGKRKLPKKCCLLTFDDGLKSQVENALPLLKQKGVPAIFFINTLPLQKNKACLVHKIHWLRAHLAPDAFLSSINKYLKPFGQSLESYNVSEKKARQQYRYDDIKTARLKLLLKTVLPVKIRESVIDNTFKELVLDEKGFCENFYMSKQHIKELFSLSLLGAHSTTHSNLADLEEAEMKKDILESVNFLSNLADGKIQSISYPYGTKQSINKGVLDFCQRIGLKIGFTMERSFNQTLKQPLLLARADCNDVPGGKYPLFKIRDEKIEATDKLTLSRQYYFTE
jgi:peptidoglycan/xylan/chitin deacetylase (PgdA/CDA1 family)